MDGAAAFLHRHERQAITKRRKKEPLRALVPAVCSQRTGLLAITPTRVLFAARRRFRTPVQQWPRRQQTLRLERRRYGVLHVGDLRFELMSRDDAALLREALEPRPASVSFTERSAPKVPSPEPALQIDRPPKDPLAHRAGASHEARLRQLHAKGVMTKAELEWQLRS